MNHRILVTPLLTLLAAFLYAAPGVADTLTLKDGQVIQGKMVSRTDEAVTFEVGGQALQFPTESVQSVAVDFDAQPATTESAPAPDTTPTAAPAEPAAPGTVTVPAGTRLMVRTNEALDSKKHGQGHKFTASLEGDLVVEGALVAPAGSILYGELIDAKKSRRATGQSELIIGFTDLMIGDQLHPISTSQVQAATESTGKKTVGRTARAAAIGGLIDGSDGAKTGAKVGLGASIITGGNQINIPARSLLEVQLAEPFSP